MSACLGGRDQEKRGRSERWGGDCGQLGETSHNTVENLKYIISIILSDHSID